jgi:hypothetical protein
MNIEDRHRVMNDKYGHASEAFGGNVLKVQNNALRFSA